MGTDDASIGKGVVVILILMSIWSVYVTIERLLVFRKAKKQSLQFAKQVTQYLAQDRLQDAIEASRKYKHSHLARVTRAGLIEFQLVDSKPQRAVARPRWSKRPGAPSSARR